METEAKSIKRRVTRVGPKHRLWITLDLDTFESLQARGEKLGYSISALANRVINRGVAAGLIDDPTPTLNEQYHQLSAELHREQNEHIEILHHLEARIALIKELIDVTNSNGKEEEHDD